MGLAALGDLLKWPAIVIGVIGAIWLFAWRFTRKLEGGAVAKSQVKGLEEGSDARERQERGEQAARGGLGARLRARQRRRKS